MKKLLETDEWQDTEYYRHIKYYCSKCKYFDKKCTKNRIIRICKEKGLKNVPN